MWQTSEKNKKLVTKSEKKSQGNIKKWQTSVEWHKLVKKVTN